MEQSKVIYDKEAIERSLVRIAHQIIEHNSEASEICLVGIQRRGVPLAREIAESIIKFSDLKVDVGALDITLYRDDLTEIADQPNVNSTDIPFDIKDKVVVLVDDVIYTGRTVRAAMDALIKIGRPYSIQLAVLIDRGHRELPIRGDYVGKNVPTSRDELIAVRLPEIDGCKMVALIKK